jgi:hypothetical protein
MLRTLGLALIPLSLALFLSGCSGGGTDPRAGQDKDRKSGEAREIEAGLAQLDPEDRKLAEAQKFCAVQNDNRLGSMGKPLKILLDDEPVFLCCAGCKAKALREKDRTLAKVKELKEKNAEPSPK